jgi:hypothetical protein
LGAWVKDASADAILFPWVVRSADVTTVVSVVNTAETDAEASGLPFHNNRIHIEYWHKMTTANEQEEKCNEYNFEVTSSKDDMVTWDISGHFNSGLPMFNDTSNEVIAAPDMTLAVEDPRRAFLIVDNNTQALYESNCEGFDVPGCNTDGTMFGEAVVIEHKTGAAWGYIAYNGYGGQINPLFPGPSRLNFADYYDVLGEVIGGGETTQTTLLNPNDATTKLFVTPVNYAGPFAAQVELANIIPLQLGEIDQRAGNWNARVQLCRFPERDSDYGMENILPYTGNCIGGGIWNNEEGGFSFTTKKNIVCTTADNIVDFFGGAGTSAYTQWIASGKAGWAYIVTHWGNIDMRDGNGEPGQFEEAHDAIIGKLEFGTGLNWNGSIADTINTFVWLRNSGSWCEIGPDDELCAGTNIIHNEYSEGLFGEPNVSDERWKKNIEPLTASLDKVMLLDGVSYDWKADEYPEMGFTKDRQIGFIAQDVEEVFPELVTTDSNGNKAVYYGQMVAVLLEAMKEQQAEISELKKQQTTIADLTEKISQLEKELEQK